MAFWLVSQLLPSFSDILSALSQRAWSSWFLLAALAGKQGLSSSLHAQVSTDHFSFFLHFCFYFRASETKCSWRDHREMKCHSRKRKGILRQKIHHWKQPDLKTLTKKNPRLADFVYAVEFTPSKCQWHEIATMTLRCCAMVVLFGAIWPKAQ